MITHVSVENTSSGDDVGFSIGSPIGSDKLPKLEI